MKVKIKLSTSVTTKSILSSDSPSNVLQTSIEVIYNSGMKTKQTLGQLTFEQWVDKPLKHSLKYDLLPCSKEPDNSNLFLPKRE